VAQTLAWRFWMGPSFSLLHFIFDSKLRQVWSKSNGNLAKSMFVFFNYLNDLSLFSVIRNADWWWWFSLYIKANKINNLWVFNNFVGTEKTLNFPCSFVRCQDMLSLSHYYSLIFIFSPLNPRWIDSKSCTHNRF